MGMPFGMAEDKWNSFCDSIKDYNGSYESYFKMMNNCVEIQNQRQKELEQQ